MISSLPNYHTLLHSQHLKPPDMQRVIVPFVSGLCLGAAAYNRIQTGWLEYPQTHFDDEVDRLPCHDQAVFLYRRLERACDERENDHSLEDPTSPAEAASALNEFLNQHQAEILQAN